MDGNDKILPFDSLTEEVTALQAQGKKIVLCHGVFDLLHIGHIRYLKQAKSFGDLLVVTITPDRYVDKGPHRPAFSEKLRLEAIASLNCVDYVAINKWDTAESTLRQLKPDYYVKGSEFKDINADRTGKIAKEQEVAEQLGIELKFTEDIVFSSSNLINKYLTAYSDEIDSYLTLFRQRYPLEKILSLIDKLANLKVLVLGDTILDEYQYCDAIGKSSKDPTLALKYRSHDLFAGGVLAVANHVANFTAHVDLLTLIGQQDSHESFIRQQLTPCISPFFFIQPDAPTTLKRRFLDGYSFNKLLEIYVMDDSGPGPQAEEEICTYLNQHLKNYDIVIAADFGHGLINDTIRRTIIDSAPYLAVNTQANAGNRGFHTISKYNRTDYCCIAEHELWLETRQRQGNLRTQMDDIRSRLDCTYFTVTLGRKGCAICDKNNDFIKIPTFARKVIDRVGAGDAFFAVSALASRCSPPTELLGFLGNIVGALAVETIGNKKAITRQSTEKFITSILK